MGEDAVRFVFGPFRVPENHGGVSLRLRDEVYLPYLDCNLEHSRTFDAHLRDICKVLQHYQQHRVKLKAKKNVTC